MSREHKKTYYFLIAIIIFFVLVVFFADVIPSNKNQTTKIAFVGDVGVTDDSKEVLKLIKEEGVDLVAFLGDFDYLDRPDIWSAQNDIYLGQDIGHIAVVGNHDVTKWSEYQQQLIDQDIVHTNFSCTGETGKKQSCEIGPVQLVGIAPGIFDGNYNDFLDEQLKNNDKPWKICMWHKDQQKMQTGDKTDEVGWDVYEICRKYGALIMTGHEHSYERTHLLSSVIDQTVADTDNDYILEAGKTVVSVIGTGGQSLRDEKRGGDWWAKIYTKDKGARPGALFCEFTVNNKTAKCYFKNIDDVVIDSFVLYNYP